MASVSKYGSYRTMTAYESVTAWKAKRKSMRQKFEAEQSAASEKLLGASVSQSSGLAEITAQVALKRITEEGLVKSKRNAELAKLSTEVDTSKADIQDSMFSSSSSGMLDSGTQIDLNAGTITLSDGSVIDAKTGAKKINITV